MLKALHTGFRRTVIALAATLVSLPALAVQPDEVLKDPALESRARALSTELRCLVCQNQSIDDSDAPLARDLRLIVREKLTAGSSDADIRRYLVDRYGEFVLLRPPLNWGTALLWLGPLGILLGGAAIVFTQGRRRKLGVTAPLTADEKRALEQITGGKA